MLNLILVQSVIDKFYILNNHTHKMNIIFHQEQLSIL